MKHGKLSLAALLALALAGCGNGTTPAPARAAAPVRVAAVEQAPAAESLRAIGVLAHASSGVCNAIWFPRRILTTVLDGIVFGILSGLVFAFFWPAATT